jgi:hypothetical protein
MNTTFTKTVFMASAIYDGVLGIIFLFFGVASFDYFGIEKPYNMGFLHFPAMLLIVFAIMFWKIALDPITNRGLIPYGMGLKFSFLSVVFYHWYADSVPFMWLCLAWTDTAFLLLYLVIWSQGKVKVK